MIRLAFFLSPLRGLFLGFRITHGLRPFDKLRAGCGLHSVAALRLEPSDSLTANNQ